jgi:hypothetical protein
MTKKELVAKVAKEQGLDPKILNRLSVAELQKMDEVVPDEGEELKVDEPTVDEPTIETEEPKTKKIFVGLHPVTGEKVYL